MNRNEQEYNSSGSAGIGEEQSSLDTRLEPEQAPGERGQTALCGDAQDGKSMSGNNQQARRLNLHDRAKLAVVRNVAMSVVIVLGCVLLVLLATNRPLVYKIFPWVEPQVVEETVSPDEGIYTVVSNPEDGYRGMSVEVVDPTLRPDLYVTIEFTYACGCPGSFVPAHGGYMEKHFPQETKAAREQMICYKCRQKLEYLEQREKLEKGE